jgi:hypothetical protein
MNIGEDEPKTRELVVKRRIACYNEVQYVSMEEIEKIHHTECDWQRGPPFLPSCMS